MSVVLELTLDVAARNSSLLGLWQERTDVELPSFGLPTAPAAVVWRTQLPSDPGDAQGILTEAQERLDASWEDVEALSWLDRSSAEWEPTSIVFASTRTDDEQGRTESRVRDALALVERIGTWCAPHAWVESTFGDRAGPRSLVSFGGTVRTVCPCAPTPAELECHRTSVDIAMQSRASVVRMVGVTARGAVRIATRLALPGGPLLAMPAVWRSLREFWTQAGADRERVARQGSKEQG